MKFIKWSTVFLLCFALSAVLLKSLSQQAFHVAVRPWIFGYPIKEYPVFYYILLAFMSGLIIGLFTAVYNYLTLKTKILSKSKRVKYLEKEIDVVNIDLDKCESQIPELKKTIGELTDKSNAFKRDAEKKRAEIDKLLTELAESKSSDSGEIDLSDLDR